MIIYDKEIEESHHMYKQANDIIDSIFRNTVLISYINQMGIQLERSCPSPRVLYGISNEFTIEEYWDFIGHGGTQKSFWEIFIITTMVKQFKGVFKLNSIELHLIVDDKCFAPTIQVILLHDTDSNLV